MITHRFPGKFEQSKNQPTAAAPRGAFSGIENNKNNKKIPKSRRESAP